MAFQKATKQSRPVKSAIFGPTGTGKTTVAAMMALYLSKKYHNGAPVAMLDSENAADFILPFFEAEGVELLHQQTRCFDDLRTAHLEAQKLSACCLITDSTTHFWQELCRSLKMARALMYCRNDRRKAEEMVRKMRMDVGMIGQAKEVWGEFSANFVSSPIHWLLCGRLAYEWENADVEDEATGKTKQELLKGGSKMKAEGDTGYEADLLIELSRADDPNAADYERLKGGKMQRLAAKQMHVALVKKCRVRELNDALFTWPSSNGYALGDYETIASQFSPYFEFVRRGAATAQGQPPQQTSVGLFAGNGGSEYYRRQQQKTIALEDWDATIQLLWPGSTANEKRLRMLVSQDVFQGVRSRTEIESQPVEVLKRGARILRKFEEKAKADGLPDSETAVLACLSVAKQIVNEEMQAERDAALGITENEQKVMEQVAGVEAAF